jgi:hypothetical protein
MDVNIKSNDTLMTKPKKNKKQIWRGRLEKASWITKRHTQKGDRLTIKTDLQRLWDKV